MHLGLQVGGEGLQRAATEGASQAVVGQGAQQQGPAPHGSRTNPGTACMPPTAGETHGQACALPPPPKKGITPPSGLGSVGLRVSGSQNAVHGEPAHI